MRSIKSEIDFLSVLSPLDWFVFTLIFIVTLMAIVYGHKLKNKQQGKDSYLDLLLMSRQLTLPLFIATLVATWYGGIFGVTQIAFEKGVYNFITQGVFWYIAYIIFALFIVSRVRAYESLTLPDLISKMFGKKSSYLSAIFNFFNVLPIAYTISLGLFLQILFGGELLPSMAIGTFLVIIYSLWGGFRAIVFSDLIQFVVMCISALLVLIFSLFLFGGPQFLYANLPKEHFYLSGGESLATTLVWGFIALSTLVDPNFYQRCFAAKSTIIAKKGILLSTIVWLLFDICTTAGAMYARATIPAAESSKAYLIYALQILPNGLRGFFLAGILATILSTLDSYIFLAGTTISHDLLPKKWRNKKVIHYAGIIFVGLISLVMASSFDGNIKIVWKTLGSYSAACLLLPVLYGYIFPGKIKDNQFVIGCTFGLIATTYWRNTKHSGFYQNIDELYIGILATSFGLIFYYLFKKIKLRF